MNFTSPLFKVVGITIIFLSNENKNALCYHYADELAYFYYNDFEHNWIGFEQSDTSNNDIFKPCCLPEASASRPNPNIVF